MKYILTILLIAASFNCFADFESYDEIVDKLSTYEKTEYSKNRSYRPKTRSFSRAHIGLGFSQTFFDADATNFDSHVQNQGGLLINLGVDILNPNWGIEGSYSNFGTSRDENSEIKLREFSLKGLYKPTLSKNWSMRLGLGVSSRFLDIKNDVASESFRTPSGLFLFGLDTYVSSFVSVGADLKFKTAMIDDTIDKNSVDLSFRFDTHF